MRLQASGSRKAPAAARRYDAAAVLRAAWARYHAAYGSHGRFHGEAFACALKLEWKVARFALEKAAEQACRDRQAAEIARTRPTRFMGRIIEPPVATTGRGK